MKKLYLHWGTLLSVVAGFLLTPGSRVVDQHSVITSSPLANTLLWKISGKNLPQPSYLFGTMHLLCAADAQLSDGLKNAIHSCDEIYFEINLDDISGMVQSLKYMLMNSNKKLSDLLNETDYQKVKGYFDKQGSLLPFSMLERFKPLLISSILEESSLDCAATNGMELVIQREAHAQSRKIKGLETAEFQAGLFDSIPYETQARDLVNYIDSAAYYKKTTRELVETYRRQDLEKIDELTRSSDAGMTSYLDLLLYQRNRKWVDSLDQLLTNKSLLIAVGAGHLPGDQGLINLLKKKGYELTPVKN
jgi:uncharacterized protein YbaP (TraB family)